MGKPFQVLCTWILITTAAANKAVRHLSSANTTFNDLLDFIEKTTLTASNSTQTRNGQLHFNEKLTGMCGAEVYTGKYTRICENCVMTSIYPCLLSCICRSSFRRSSLALASTLDTSCCKSNSVYAKKGQLACKKNVQSKCIREPDIKESCPLDNSKCDANTANLLPSVIGFSYDTTEISSMDTITSNLKTKVLKYESPSMNSDPRDVGPIFEYADCKMYFGPDISVVYLNSKKCSGKTRTYKSSSALVSRLSAKVGTPVGKAFDLSVQAESVFEQENFFAVDSCFVEMFSAVLTDYLNVAKISKSFLDDVQSLPPSVIIDKYGTHVITGFVAGYGYRTTMDISSTSTAKTTNSAIRDVLKVLKVSANADFSSSSQEVLGDQSVSTFFVGGLPNKLKAGCLDAFMATGQSAPSIIYVHAERLDHLVPKELESNANALKMQIEKVIAGSLPQDPPPYSCTYPGKFQKKCTDCTMPDYSPCILSCRCKGGKVSNSPTTLNAKGCCWITVSGGTLQCKKYCSQKYLKDAQKSNSNSNTHKQQLWVFNMIWLGTTLISALTGIFFV